MKGGGGSCQNTGKVPIIKPSLTQHEIEGLLEDLVTTVSSASMGTYSLNLL